MDDDENEDSDFAADGDGDSEEEEEAGSEEEEAAAAASTKSKKRGRKPAAADDKAKKKKKKGSQFFDEEADEVGGCRAWPAQAPAHPARSVPPPAVVRSCCRACSSSANAIIIVHTCSRRGFVAYTNYQVKHTAAVSPGSNSNESSGVSSTGRPTPQQQYVRAAAAGRAQAHVCRWAHAASESTSCVPSSPTQLLHTHRCSRACGCTSLVCCDRRHPDPACS